MFQKMLGKSTLSISQLGLGTMTFGSQVDEKASHRILDLALGSGINFVDTAEMYSIPVDPKTQGRSERIVGNWLQGIDRSRVVVATKVVGPGEFLSHIRGGKSRLNYTNIKEAVCASLARLQTEYIDLYQIHWPERPATSMRIANTDLKPLNQLVSIDETTEALMRVADEGLIRDFGISNETAWGTMRYMRAFETGRAPRIASIQNRYNLLDRTAERSIAEVCHNEDVSFLAYGVLGSGVLADQNSSHENAIKKRLERWPEYWPEYTDHKVQRIAMQYRRVANEFGLDASEMAITWAMNRSFVTSVILGVSSVPQLESALRSNEISISDELDRRLDSIHSDMPDPILYAGS